MTGKLAQVLSSRRQRLELAETVWAGTRSQVFQARWETNSERCCDEESQNKKWQASSRLLELLREAQRRP